MSLLTAGAVAAGGIVLLPLIAVVAAGSVVAVAPVAVGPALPKAAASAPELATPAAKADVPRPMLRLYERAATVCPGLPWTILAAIGTVESDNDRSDLPGVHSGGNSAGAEGPMQFEPATFAAFDRPVPAGGAAPPSVYDPVDAVYAAARLLCADGGRDAADLPAAIFAYNHSTAYVARVTALADRYGRAQATPAQVALSWALHQIGTPYAWGGETPGVGFDCSGLVQAAYRFAGILLPRVAQDQYDAGPHLAPDTPLQPGDLVFFGASVSDVTHVGMVVRAGTMVDAPHTGAFVRLEPFPSTPGAAWGGDIYVGATRPDQGAMSGGP